MKKVVFPILFLMLTCSAVLSQESKRIPPTKKVTVLSVKSFLDSINKKKEGIIAKGFTPATYPKPQTVSELIQRTQKNIPPNLIPESVMPVWSPDSTYVFNMPGTHAYDKNQYRYHIPRFVTVVKRTTPKSAEINSDTKK